MGIAGDVYSLGFFRMQDFDAKDAAGKTYSESAPYVPLPILYGARYTLSKDENNVSTFQQVDGTVGPLAGWICWAPAGSRTRAQWGQQFYVKITTVGPPIKATPVLNVNGDLDTTLAETTVTTVDGTIPALNSFGLVVAGSTLHSQELIFFAGGSGSGGILANITGQVADNIYNWVELQWSDMTALPGGRNALTDGTAKEAQGSTVITSGQRVLLYKGGGSSQLYFFLPMGKCT